MTVTSPSGTLNSKATPVLASSLKRRAGSLLARADIQINGNRPWDITIRHNEFFSRVFCQGSIGLGESYMEGWWDVPALDQFFDRVFRARLDRTAIPAWPAIRLHLISLFLNVQKKPRAFKVGENHYDLGNELFEAMLDKRMVYTCADWQNAANLDDAQKAKLGDVCRALNLQPGMRVLDIGCGWASFAKFAAENYGVCVTGITVSREQAKLATKRCAGLPVEIRVQDYRDLRGQFDCAVSLGMFEHVGYKNYRTYMNIVRRAIAGCGRFYLSSIGKNRSARTTDPWIEKYIFPNSMLPSLKQIGAAAEKFFVLDNLQNWGTYYDRTLMAWYCNFESHWDELRRHYNERFFRMWKFYLMSSAGSFRSGRLQCWQMLFSPKGTFAYGPQPMQRPLFSKLQPQASSSR